MEAFAEFPKSMIPDEIHEKWQSIVDILMRVVGVPVVLLTRAEESKLTVLHSSQCAENPFKAGNSFELNTNLYCEATMRRRAKLKIPNALKDPEWARNPSVEAGLISYLGFPIFNPDQTVFGTLCVIDREENEFSDDLEELMRQFKDLIENHLLLIHQEGKLKDRIEAVEKMNRMLVGRELRIIELKEKIAALEDELKRK